MLTDQRRNEILNILQKHDEPITGNELANRFNVSRQVIVQDIAVLRAQGHDILATSKGYMMYRHDLKKNNIKTIVCKHQGYDSMEEELRIMVDMGVKILDVIVEHPIYGEIRTSLMIGSRMDLHDFIHKVRKHQAEPLSVLTGGEHIHTLEVPDDRAYHKMIGLLRQRGYLSEEEKK
jgi:transcriptional regulator of NAD metabolism